jgi:prepilin-type N-terminal cleavage/methylation domain-containing protein
MGHRRGFTLVEVLVSLVVMLIVTGAIYELLHSTQRLSRSQAERVSLQSNVRSGALIVPTELRELATFVGGSADQNDVLITPAGGTDITYRAMRGIGFVCQTPTTATEILVARSSYSGYRDPQAARDGIYVFLDGDDAISTDDVWLPPFTVTGVATGSTCGGAAAIALTVSPSNTVLTTLPVGTPVRIYEVMQLQLYTDAGGKSWLGARSVSTGEAIQPVLGPLTPGNGLAMEYLDASGNITTDVKAIKSIRVTIRGVTDQKINLGSGSSGTLTSVQDSLVTQVVLRNAFRP